MLAVSEAIDLIGYNYHEYNYATFHDRYPGKKFIATETTSGLEMRGHYDMPSDSIRIWPSRWDKPFTEGNPATTIEFDGPPSDPAPTDFVLELGQKQDTAIRDWQAA